nr:MAG TPA: hypothetical protein [Caudoviricetes sp.]
MVFVCVRKPREITPSRLPFCLFRAGGPQKRPLKRPL